MALNGNEFQGRYVLMLGIDNNVVVENKTKVAVKKRVTTARKRSLELKVEVARNLLRYPEWLESFGRLEHFEDNEKMV